MHVDQFNVNDYSALDPDLIDSIAAYVRDGRPTGDFLKACLENDLCKAVARADNDNLSRIPIIVSFLHNKTPSTCWGSTQAVEQWMNDHEARRSYYGNCCHCYGPVSEEEGVILMANFRAPKPGTGWGCRKCGLPRDGAVYILCKSCFDAKVEARFFVCGEIREKSRIPVSRSSLLPFEHDDSLHGGEPPAVCYPMDGPEG